MEGTKAVLVAVFGFTIPELQPVKSSAPARQFPVFLGSRCLVVLFTPAGKGRTMSGLQEAFENFKLEKAALQRIHEDTIACFDKIRNQLSESGGADTETEENESVVRSQPTSPSSDEDVVLDVADVDLDLDLADVLYGQKEKTEVERIFTQEPALIVIGQTNCGKSSIVNELLGMKVLPTSDRPCTARIVRLTYAERPYVQIRARDGKMLERVEMEGAKTRVPRDMIDLSKADREDSSKAGESLVVGLPLEFLKAGVDIIDSPGKNENKVLDNLVEKQLENVLPCVIYVVDGHNLFTSQVCNFILYSYSL